jgi:hypothetical protein
MSDLTREEQAGGGRTHVLKIWPEYFEAVASGAKTFEVRKNDRGFEVGDTLSLHEFEPGSDGGYTGRSVVRRVSYILSSAAFGLELGYVVMGLAAPQSPSPAEGGIHLNGPAPYTCVRCGRVPPLAGSCCPSADLVGELVGALKAFASFAGNLHSQDDDDLRIELRHPDDARSAFLTAGDFRRARAALALAAQAEARANG